MGRNSKKSIDKINRKKELIYEMMQKSGIDLTQATLDVINRFEYDEETEVYCSFGMVFIEWKTGKTHHSIRINKLGECRQSAEICVF